MFISKNKPTRLQIGLWKNGEHYECVWFNEKDQPQFCLLKHPISADDIPTYFITDEKKPSLKSIKFITAITPQHTWVKTLLLPQHLSDAECEAQCRFLLSQELPIPIEEVWFDYQSEQITQGFKLTLFAIKKHIATDYLNTYSPFPIQVLDCCINSIIRAFQYVIPASPKHNCLYVYSDEQDTFAIHSNKQQIQFIQKTEKNLTALVDLFYQRYEFSPEKIYVYCAQASHQVLPQDWLKVETELPFIALGNALWRKSFLQNENEKNEY